MAGATHRCPGAGDVRRGAWPGVRPLFRDKGGGAMNYAVTVRFRDGTMGRREGLPRGDCKRFGVFTIAPPNRDTSLESPVPIMALIGGDR